MTTTRVFDDMVKACYEGCRYINSVGGARSTKTFSALQLLIYLALYDSTPQLTSVVSETFPHLKKGAIRDFQTIMRAENLWSEDNWNATDSIYTFPSGSQIEFFSADNAGRVHGPARDRLFVNEAQNLRWEVMNQLRIRTTGMITIDYNPTHEFWAHKEIEPDPRTATIHSTYLDNCFLTADQIRDIEAGKKNERWWRVYGLGLVGQLEGLIYDFTQIDALPDPHGLVHLYGLDYGFTNDPTALLDIYADTRRKIAYIDELLYKRGMFNSDIIAAMAAAGAPKTAPVYADCAEPKANKELQVKGGYNIQPSYKGTDKKFQLNFTSGWEFKVTKASTNWIHEARNYTWAKDRDGNLLNVPIEFNDHCMDAMRYALFTAFGQFERRPHDGRAKTTRAW